jgi:hypothetical protein
MPQAVHLWDRRGLLTLLLLLPLLAPVYNICIVIEAFHV